MKWRPPKVILTAAAIAARMTCSGQQVYSQSVGSFFVGEINPTNIVQFPIIHYGNDEVVIADECFTSGTNSSFISSFVAWIVSTNVLANQPRWDGISNNVPLTISKACTLVLPQVRKQFPEVQSWTVKSISLCKPAPGSFPNLWGYEFIFDEQTNAYAQRAFVLLDGTVVLPTIAR
jgi:hypothetical protein